MSEITFLLPGGAEYTVASAGIPLADDEVRLFPKSGEVVFRVVSVKWVVAYSRISDVPTRCYPIVELASA